MIKRQGLNRIIASVAIVATLFMLLFSTVYIETHIHHHCTGNDCPICATIEQCTINLKILGTAIIVASTLFSVFFILQQTVADNMLFVAYDSLVSQKVRMDN